MKKIFPLVLLFLIVVSRPVRAQVYLPVATSGYTHDAIAEINPATATTTGPLDGVNVMYSQAYAAVISSPYGLPNSGLITSGTKTFQLQSYNGPNMLFIQPTGQDSLTFLTPVACQSLSLLDFATDAFSPTSMSVTIRFTDNSTQVFSGVTVYDWLYTLQPNFFAGFDRMNRSAGTAANEGSNGPRFFTTDFAISCANQSKKIKRIIIKNTGTANEKLCIMAVAATINPLSALASPVGVCTGGSSTLTASGLGTYTWLPAGNFAGSTSTTVPVTPAATTEYTVQALTALNCMVNAMITVNVYTAVPSLTVSNTANSGGICPTKTINLTASGAVTYTWTGGAVTITNGVAFAPSSGGNYTVTGENACGTSSAVTSVSIHPLPTVFPAVSVSTLCAGGTLTLTASGNATNYVWSGGSAPGGNGAGFVPPAGSLTFSVVGTSALSCTAMATIPATVYASPNAVPVASPPLVCIGNSATLTANGALSYTWSSSTQTVTGNPQFVVTPTGTGVTTYTVTKGNSTCFDTKVISITTNSLPTIFAIANPPVVCALQPATLSIGGGTSYTWTAPGTPNFSFTGASPVVYPAASSEYTAAASDGTCIARTTVSVTTNPNPTITTTASSPSLCIGQQVTVTAFGGNSYTWTVGSNTSTGTSITDSPTSAAAYNVVGDNNFGCTASTQQIVLVYPLPPTQATAAKALACSGGSVLLTASGAHSYTWDANAGGIVSPTVIVFPNTSTSGQVTYTVAGSYTTTGCAFSKTLQVGVYVPTLSVSGTTIACVGGQVSLMAGGGNPNTYTWSTGTQTSTFPSLTTTLAAPAVFTVSAMSTSVTVNCPATRTVAVANHSVPVITAVAERSLICPKESTQLFAGGGVSYSWSNSQAGGTITVAPQAQTNNYTVTGTDGNNCVGTGSVQVKLQNCTGIREQGFAGAGLLVYPNPNNGVFTIQAPSEMTLFLSNELGQHIRTLSLSSANHYSISVGDLNAGIYFLSGSDAAGPLKQKVIVTK